jgi:glycosyltransferase involved in cell wall biosynthesis
LVSIIIPSKESPLILERALKEIVDIGLNADFAIEVIVAYDFASKGILEIQEKFNSVRFIASKDGERFGAIRSGVEASRGEYIVLWSADSEYSAKDLASLVGVVRGQGSPVAIGSRAHFAPKSGYLRQVYSSQPLLYWLSRVGGITVSFASSLRLGRFVSDPFCGIAAMTRETALSHLPIAGGAEGFLRMLISLSSKDIGYVEVGLSYVPRVNVRDKKTGVRDGIRALLLGMGFRK